MISRFWKKKSLGLSLMAVLVPAVLVAAMTQGDQRRMRRPPFDPKLRLHELDRTIALPASTAKYASDRVIVKFKSYISAQSIRNAFKNYGTSKFSSIASLGVYKVFVPAGATAETFLYALQRNPNVEYAEPDYRTRFSVVPDDEYFWRQYALKNTGQGSALPGNPVATADSDIKATAAWEKTTGTSDVVIAILDTGVDLAHPDIMNKLVSSGRDYVNDDYDATDDNWHGTHVAGIAGAETNNSQGIAGVAWNARILPVKILDSDGRGYYSDLIDGIIWATDQGAKVINMSLGGESPSNALMEAVRYAHDNGVVVVAAAGNDGDFVSYPAAYDDYCLAVAATDYQDLHASFSNPGAQVDIAAPGVKILSLIPTWLTDASTPPYAFASGTSMAAPHVAGFAALIRSLKPLLSVDDCMNVIRYSSDDVNSSSLSGKDNEIGYGRINMERALVPYKLTSQRS